MQASRSLEPLLPGLPLRERGDAARRRPDHAAAGQRSHGAHHRRERHGQGTGRARHPRRVAAQLGDVPARTTARPRRASSPTASCSAIAAAASPARSPTSPGLVRSAAGGTLFLDEIGDLPLDVQPKLLRFLEQGEIMPVGETRPQRVDVRVIAATNADLEQRVGEGKFREDLVLPPERDPHPGAAAARAARGGAASRQLLPARGVRAPRRSRTSS